MEVRLQPAKEAQFAEIAAKRGLKPDELAQQVLSRYLEDDSRFIEAVNLGLAAADCGTLWSTTKWGPRFNRYSGHNAPALDYSRNPRSLTTLFAIFSGTIQCRRQGG